MRFAVLVLAVLVLVVGLANAAEAQVYRWVDREGRTTYSQALPPGGARATLLGADARGGFGAVLPVEAPTTARAPDQIPVATARTVPEARGLDFRTYLSIRRGMSEAELLAIAGPPDLFAGGRYAYLPTRADPYITTISLMRGRVRDIERVRRL